MGIGIALTGAMSKPPHETYPEKGLRNGRSWIRMPPVPATSPSVVWRAVPHPRSGEGAALDELRHYCVGDGVCARRQCSKRDDRGHRRAQRGRGRRHELLPAARGRMVLASSLCALTVMAGGIGRTYRLDVLLVPASLASGMMAALERRRPIWDDRAGHVDRLLRQAGGAAKGTGLGSAGTERRTVSDGADMGDITCG